MVFLGFGFWMVYRKPNATCEGDSCCSVAALKRRKKNIGVMWVVAFATIATSTYPSWGAIGATTAVAQASYLSTSTKQLVLNVPSMDCAACAQPILSATTKIPGVVSASVDVDKKTAAVVVKSDFKGKEELLWAVKAAGFEATLEGNTR
jgi:copper chaperone CopZ